MTTCKGILDINKGGCMRFTTAWEGADQFTSDTVIEAFDGSPAVLDEIEFEQVAGGFTGYLPEAKVAQLQPGAVSHFRIRVRLAPGECADTTDKVMVRVV